MRKRNLIFFFDTVFWYLLYFFPVIVYLIVVVPFSGYNIIPFATCFENIGLGFVSDNVVITSLRSIFGSGGVFPLFSTDTPFIIFAWFICTYIAHLAVDFLLFIPRLAHKWLNKTTQGD